MCAFAGATTQQFPQTAFIEAGKQRLDATIAVQTEFFNKWQEMNRDWLARARSGVELNSELTIKLMAARSVPAATAAWQEWANKQMKSLSEDCFRLVTESQKVVETGVRLCCANGWTGSTT